MRNRELYKKLTAFLYKRGYDDDDVDCLYCGELADCIDHFLPISFLASLVEVGVRVESVLVKSCFNCNSIASDKVFSTVNEKRKHIYDRLKEKSKNKKLLSLPEWTEDELSELSYTLRAVVVKDIRKKETLLRRLEFMELVGFDD